MRTNRKGIIAGFGAFYLIGHRLAPVPARVASLFVQGLHRGDTVDLPFARQQHQMVVRLPLLPQDYSGVMFAVT